MNMSNNSLENSTDPYSPAEIDICGSLIKFKDPMALALLGTELQRLGRALLSALSRKGKFDPRNAAHALEILHSAIERMEKAFVRVENEQKQGGDIRQLLPCSEPSWDEVDDARNTLKAVAPQIRDARNRFRSAMGSSPQKAHPELQWAAEIYHLWKHLDSKGLLGKRDGEGRFRRFLEAAAEPISLKLVWKTVHDRIRDNKLD
jgi:hypothetical protein